MLPPKNLLFLSSGGKHVQGGGGRGGGESPGIPQSSPAKNISEPKVILNGFRMVYGFISNVRMLE